MSTLDLTGSRFGVGDLSTDFPLLQAHAENFEVRTGTRPTMVRLTSRQWAEVAPCLSTLHRWDMSAGVLSAPCLAGIPVSVVDAPLTVEDLA